MFYNRRVCFNRKYINASLRQTVMQSHHKKPDHMCMCEFYLMVKNGFCCKSLEREILPYMNKDIVY